MLQPGDTSIVIDPGPPPLRAFIPSFIPAPDLLAGYASLANTVAVARIESRVPKLTADGRWIVTSVRAMVIEAFKPPKTSRGQPVEFQQSGGELKVDGVSVAVKAEWETAFKVGERYLLFVEGAGPTASVRWSYRITSQDTLASLFPGFLEDGEVDTGDGLPLNQARVYLKK